MEIKILGTGCARCHKLEEITRETVRELNLPVSIEVIRDISKIMEYPIIMTPGLIINDKVVCAGKIPKKQEIVSYIQELQKELEE